MLRVTPLRFSSLFFTSPFSFSKSLFTSSPNLGKSESSGEKQSFDQSEELDLDSLDFLELEILAKKNNLRAQFHLGFFYESQNNMEKAKYWFEQTANAGLAEAQCQLGVYYEFGISVPQSSTRALDWFQKSAQQGFPLAQSFLVDLMESDCKLTDAERIDLLKQADVLQVGAISSYELGVRYASGNGTPSNLTLAVEALKKAAEQDYVPALELAADLLISDSPLDDQHSKNIQQALSYYQKAVDLSASVHSLVQIGKLYHRGLVDVESKKDLFIKARQSYELASNQNSFFAKQQLWKLLKEKKGEDLSEWLENDHITIHPCLESLATAGDYLAMFHLAKFYHKGWGGFPINSFLAIKLMNQVAWTGYGPAEHYLALLMLQACQDDPKAFLQCLIQSWLFRALDHGIIEARQTLKDHFSEITIHKPEILYGLEIMKKRTL